MINPYQQANRAKKAASIAALLASLKVSAAVAQQGGMGGETPLQRTMEANFRRAAAKNAGYPDASEECWRMVVEALQRAEGCNVAK